MSALRRWIVSLWRMNTAWMKSQKRVPKPEESATRNKTEAAPNPKETER